MPDLTELWDITKPVTIDFYGLPIQIHYRPAAMTVAREQRFFSQRDAESEVVYERILETFIKVIASWDMTREGEPLPITPEGLSQVPTRVLWELLHHVEQDTAFSKNGASGSSTH